ncbi:MAG TPA: phospholipase D-like domain-containing protein [Burkholderiales bacterium]|nr:phospholipase D-like domain-containing protein [Burkholderiales bacterium]
MFIGTTIVNWLTLHGLVAVLAILVYVVTTHTMRQRRQPAAAIAWILFILLLPYLALPAYLSFGSRKLARPRSGAPIAPFTPHETVSWAVETIAALGQPAPVSYRDLRLHENGTEAKRALLELVGAARQTVDLCTFILGRDQLGATVLDALCAAARRGVRVRVLVDGLGYLMAGRPKLKRLGEAGASYALFVPPLSSPLKGRTNLRNHRKLLIADAGSESGRLWCGGRNLAAQYFDGCAHTRAWRDLSFDLRGPLVRQARILFEHDWNFASGRPESPEAVAATDSPRAADGAQVIASGPDQLDDTIYAVLVTAAYQARSRIALVTPYFVPDAGLLVALCLAARRGVSVDLLLPERSNHRLSDFARNRALRALAFAGGRVWLAPRMVHAKLAVIDDALALAGSANLDNRSFFLNYELMVAFHRAADVRRFAGWFAAECRDASTYAPRSPSLLRDVAEGTLLWLGFQL